MSRLGFILLLISVVCACRDESTGDFHGVIDNREYIGNDIAYNKFICDGTNHLRTAVDLKNLLAEIVEDMHIEGRCFVKYEYKQACFHITVRP